MGRCIVEAIWIYDNSKKTALRDTFIYICILFAFDPFSVGFIIISGDNQYADFEILFVFSAFAYTIKPSISSIPDYSHRSFKSSMAPRDSSRHHLSSLLLGYIPGILHCTRRAWFAMN